MQALHPQLAELDAACRQELGIRFSHEAWGQQEFLRSFPGKWQLSCVALDQAGGVMGFWIASRRDSRIVHTYRVAVRPQLRRQGVGEAMFQHVERTSEEGGAEIVTLMVQIGNVGALSFYERLGFRPPTPSECVAFAEDHNKRCRAQEGIIVEPGDIEYRLLVLDVGEKKEP